MPCQSGNSGKHPREILNNAPCRHPGEGRDPVSLSSFRALRLRSGQAPTEESVVDLPSTRSRFLTSFGMTFAPGFPFALALNHVEASKDRVQVSGETLNKPVIRAKPVLECLNRGAGIQ